MTQKGSKNNARRFYSQLLLPGYSDIVQSGNQNSDSEAHSKEKGRSLENWEQEQYTILVPIIVKQVSVSSSQYEYQVCINANPDLPVIPHNRAGKKATEQSFTIPGKKGRKKTQVSMVYGISEEGKGTFSRPIGLNPLTGITDIFVAVLGEIDRAIERRVCYIKGQEDNQMGSDTSSTQPQTDVGSNQEGRRSKTLRTKVRAKDKAEESS